MKLEIDLANREEVAAAVPLLQIILNETSHHTCTGSGACKSLGIASIPITGSSAEFDTNLAGPTIEQLQASGILMEVPAAPAAPLPDAPSIAGAVPSMTVPEAPTGILTIVTTDHVPPVPTPENVVPTVAPPTASPAVTVELDSRGLPWDERIHASTKSKIANGEWKAKRGVDDALVTSVEAELHANVAVGRYGIRIGPNLPAPAVTANWPIPEAPTMDAATAFAQVQEVPAVLAAPFVPPVAPLTPVAPVAPSVSAAPTTFEQLMPRITAAVAGGILPPTAVGTVCTSHGVASIVTLQQQPQFVPVIWAALQQQYPGLQ